MTPAALATITFTAAAVAIVATYAIPAYRRHRAVSDLMQVLRDAGFSDDTVVDLMSLLHVAAASEEGRLVFRVVLRRCGYSIPECLNRRERHE